MQVVILTDTKGVGKKGELKEVKTGYAVNYLVPRGIAAIATEEVVRRIQRSAERRQKQKAAADGSVKKLVGKVGSKKVRIKVKVSSGGRLYDSLSQKDVEAILQKEWKLEGSGVKVKLDLPQPIRELGKYPVDVEFVGPSSQKQAEIILEFVGE